MKIGLVGCGKIAHLHATVIKKNISNPTLIFCDRNKHKADNLAKRLSPGATYTSIDELLANENLDSLHVLTQPYNHAALAERALADGLHTYVEKPLVEKASEYSSLLKIAKSQDKQLYGGYSTLGVPSIQKVKSIIDSGKFGRLITVHCDYNWSVHGNAIPYDNEDHWAYSLKGGILQNKADHPTSIIVDVLDEIHDHTMLFSRRVPLPNNTPDLLHVSINNDYQIGSYTMSLGHGSTRGHVVYCLEAATIRVDLRSHLLTITPGRGPHSPARRTQASLKLGWDISSGSIGYIASQLVGSNQRQPGVVELIKNFYNVIDGKAAPIVSENTVVQITTLLEQIWDEMSS